MAEAEGTRKKSALSAKEENDWAPDGSEGKGNCVGHV